MKKSFLCAMLAFCALASANAQLIFTQYYEGPSTNKWLELKNLGEGTLDLTIYTVSLYSNGNDELWKAGTAASANFALTGTLAAGGILIIGNSANTTPSYVTGAVSNNTIANFNGNDSIVLWNNTSAYSTTQLVDAISFTNSGNEGVDKSFVRTSADIGYSLTLGTSILDFSSVWTNTPLADVNTATAGTDNYIGFSSVAAVPEPGTVALVGLGLGVVLFGVRRRSRA